MRPLGCLIESSVNSLYKVSLRHCCAIKVGAINDTYSANNILSGYTKCRELDIALKLFDEIPNRDTVTWNSMIAGYVNCGSLESAGWFLKTMKSCGFMVDVYTFGSILKGAASVRNIDLGLQIHSLVIKTGYGENVYSASALLDMYAKCDRVHDAYAVFQCMPDRNSVSWNALISGYAQMGDRKTSFSLLNSMEREGVSLEDGTFAPLLTLLDDPEVYKLTMVIHAKTIKCALEFENTVCNATITSYSECGSVEDAKKVFAYAASTRDIVTWNSMLAAYATHNLGTSVFKLFREMQRFGFKPDIYTYTCVISACFEESHQMLGKSMHAMVIKKGFQHASPVSNSLITMYLKSDRKQVEDAMAIFQSMNVKDIISWNSMLTGLSQYGLSEHALMFFRKMRHGLLQVDHYAYSAVLRSCSDLATLQLGRQVHALVLKTGFESNDFVASSLIYMYSKCGIIEDARRSFEATPKDSSVTWNSIIFGYAQHGQGKVALDLFSLMKENIVKLDHITFVAVLTACSHMGFVDEGYNILKSMGSYGIPPRMEHYACGIDLFGRAGRLKEAKDLVDTMPFEPDAMVLRTLLGACRACGDVELATQVASRLLDIEPEEHCTYVILSNMYGHLKKWDEKASVKRLMRERGVQKVPGLSWIEVKNEVHSFNAADQTHPSSGRIYQVLEELVEEINTLEDMTYVEQIISDLDLGECSSCWDLESYEMASTSYAC